MFYTAASIAKKIFGHDTKSTTTLSLLLIVISVITKALGLINQIVINNKLGTNSLDLAMYNIASIIPELLSSVIFLGSLSAAVIPTLHSVRAKKGDSEFIKTFHSGLRIFTFIFLVFSIITILFTPQILPYFLNGRTFSTVEIDKIIFFTRILLIPQVILGTSAYLMSGLQTLYKFIVPQLTGLIYNVGLLLGSVVLLNYFQSDKIYALFIAGLLASVLHLIVQIPSLKQLSLINFDLRRLVKLIDINNLDIKTKAKNLIGLNSDTWQMLKLGGPQILGTAANQILMSAEKFIIQNVSVSAINQLRFASSLINVPFSMVVYTFSTIALSKMSKEFANNRPEDAKEIFLKILNQVLYITIPITAVMIILRIPLVRLTFGLSSRLEWLDTLSIAWIILFFSLGLIFDIVNAILSQPFYAAKNTKTPLILNLFIVIFGIILADRFAVLLSHTNVLEIQKLNLNFSYLFGDFARDSSGNVGIAAIGGIGLASSFVNFIAFFLFIITINKKLFKLSFDEFWLKLFRKLGTGVIMTFTMYFVSKFFEMTYETAEVKNLLLSTLTILFFGFLSYFISGLLFKVEESFYISDKIKDILKL